ncbi:MAG: chorismate mutase [Candidatus Jordarchaeales archaeon]
MGEIEELREKIMEATVDVLKAVKRRIEYVEALGKVKRERGLPIRDPEAEKRLIVRVREEGVKMGLDPDFCEKLVRMLIEYSVVVQMREAQR